MIDRAIFYEHPVAFRDALRDHVRRHVHAFATTRDLLSAFDRVSTSLADVKHDFELSAKSGVFRQLRESVFLSTSVTSWTCGCANLVILL